MPINSYLGEELEKKKNKRKIFVVFYLFISLFILTLFSRYIPTETFIFPIMMRNNKKKCANALSQIIYFSSHRRLVTKENVLF